MSRPPRTVIEYRNYELPADFPIQMLSGENWRISDVPSGVLHFHNCLEIGLCESDGGFLGFRGEQRAFRAGGCDDHFRRCTAHDLVGPRHREQVELSASGPVRAGAAALSGRGAANGELLQQAVQGHYYILSPPGISGGAVAGPVHAGRDAAAPDGLCDQRAGAVRGAGR